LYSYDFGNTGKFEITLSSSPTATVPSAYLVDGPNSLDVRGRITDKNGGFTDYTTTLQINNVAPTATFTAGGPVDEGSPATIRFTSPCDPSSVDTAAGFHYSYALSQAGLAMTSGTAAAGPSKAFTFEQSGQYTVWGRIFDKNDG